MITGDSATLRLLFAKIWVSECYGDFSPTIEVLSEGLALAHRFLHPHRLLSSDSHLQMLALRRRR